MDGIRNMEDDDGLSQITPSPVEDEVLDIDDTPTAEVDLLESESPLEVDIGTSQDDIGMNSSEEVDEDDEYYVNEKDEEDTVDPRHEESNVHENGEEDHIGEKDNEDCAEEKQEESNVAENGDEDYVDGNGEQNDTSEPYGDMIVEIDGKKFYTAIEKKKEIIRVGDSVDVVHSFINSESRLTCVAKIASIFQDDQGELKAEVAFYYDANDKIPGSERLGPVTNNESQWKGFTHHNEVVASNKFEIVDVDTFDETVEVYSSLEEYQEAIRKTDDEIANTFCQTMCYYESFSLKPFDVKTDWKRIMLEYSRYHRVYHTDDAPYGMQDLPQIDEEEIIIGREEEAAKIKTFIETGIRQGGTGQLLYISGVPGTGKTATVNMIVRSLLHKKMKGKLPWFDLVEINGVHLVDPNDFYRTLYSKLMKKPAPNHVASYQLLDEYFSHNTTPCVLIVDEVDYIVTKRQKVLFTIFDWPQRQTSKLIVVIISNTMDLPSKMKASCVSRLAFGSLVFHPYRYQQILDVIKAKMGAESTIDEVSLQLCARRVTNYNGDMRKALQICKLALAQAQNGRVTTSDMNKVSNRVLSSAVVDALQQVSTATSCLLVAIVLELKETQLSVACARRVYYAFRGMMAVVRPELDVALSIEAYRKLLVSIAQSGIISLEPTVFPTITGKRKADVYEELSEDLGDTGIVPEVDVGQIVTALSRDPYWERKLRDL